MWPCGAWIRKIKTNERLSDLLLNFRNTTILLNIQLYFIVHSASWQFVFVLLFVNRKEQGVKIKVNIQSIFLHQAYKEFIAMECGWIDFSVKNVDHCALFEEVVWILGQEFASSGIYISHFHEWTSIVP